MTLTPSDTQWTAIKQIIEWYGDENGPQEFYVAGFAGVGKSFIVAVAIEELREKYGIKKISSGAYTGKAAHVMRRKGVANADTIHGLIYQPVLDPRTGQMRFELNELGPASEADLIVLDECSMVSVDIANDLRSFGKKILVMGDPGQLPPVSGAGAFTNRKPDVFLTEIHRQAADSPIIRVATMARLGERIKIGDYGNTVRVRLLANDRNAVYVPDTQLICGTHRTRWAVTQNLRHRRGFNDNLPEEGEPLLCIRNNKEIQLFNGALGVAASAPVADPVFGTVTLDIKMEDIHRTLRDIKVVPTAFREHFEGTLEKPYPRKGIEEFDWGYVLTCHKAQGSEFDHVTIIDDSGAFRDEQHRWLYTALTRASTGVTLLKRSA